ncbi:hypothetical protein FEZ18_06350 [Oceanihabitans sp. IOP_32]|uniref:hypothetical protein n=1 Tax=Oceanihabitans sp. IOP_32 TaxID=2529032 RepID=UPI001293A078|nr:hypothetical protein [Oceanihabitans sp. IOP_32]QFZ54442.1 hypothetical protein FEZ18_06350 [Oceanihabitans sp. IOP_32]
MSKDLPQPTQSDEVDLGQLFKLIGNGFNRFFKFIGSIFKSIFLAFVWLVFFIKKHLVKLAIAAVIGIILGVVLDQTSDPVYKSYITVKQNYDTGENLNSAINYYNDLVKQKDLNTLEAVLGINQEELAAIIDFEMKSVTSENEKLVEYDAYLKTIDTALVKNIDFETFSRQYKTYNHKYQQIAIKAKQRNSFNALFSKIIENINTNPYLKREQEKDLQALQNQALAISKSLVKSDTLLSVYQKAILKSAEFDNNFQGKITVIDNEEKFSSTKDFELYNKDLELREQLVEIEREIADKAQIIEITSSAQDSGSVDDRKNFFGYLVSAKIFYALALLTLSFIVLLGIEFIKFLDRYKDKV